MISIAVGLIVGVAGAVWYATDRRSRHNELSIALCITLAVAAAATGLAYIAPKLAVLAVASLVSMVLLFAIKGLTAD